VDFFPVGGTAICIDTSASTCLSNNKDDFTHIDEVLGISIKGIGNSLTVQGSGTLTWLIVDDHGTDVQLTVNSAIYVPKCPVCLLSPQHNAKQTKTPGDGFNAEAHSGTLKIGG
jgi:hypothetical protein